MPSDMVPEHNLREDNITQENDVSHGLVASDGVVVVADVNGRTVS